MPRRKRGDPPRPRVIRYHVRLSFADLEAFITTYHDMDPEVESHDGGLLELGRRQTISRIARLTCTERGVVHRWVNDGVPYFAADRAAAGLNVNANNIWPGFSELEPYEYRPIRTGDAS